VGGRTREGIIVGLNHAYVVPRPGQPAFEYAYRMEKVPLAAKPGIRSALFIGLGAGVVESGLRVRGIQSVVVDIGPVVVRMMEMHLDFRLIRRLSSPMARPFRCRLVVATIQS
jgi:hypothetical protein